MAKRALQIASMALLIVTSMSLSLSASEGGQGKSGKAKEKSKHEEKEQHDDGPEFSVEFLLDFTTEEARRLAARNELIGMKPLPPGIRKNLARGKPLPPGIAKQTLPDAYIEVLPRHDEYVWRRAGTDLVLVAKSDGLVVEIAADVFR